MQAQASNKVKIKKYSVTESVRKLPFTLQNNENRYPKDEFLGLSSEEKLLRVIFSAPENIETASEEKPESNLYGGMMEHPEIKSTESDNISEEIKDAVKVKSSETVYRTKKIQRKKKYSAMAKQDMTDFEDFIAVNDNFHCDYSSVRNSLLYSR